MARTSQNLRNSKGRYIKLTILTKVKRYCNKFMGKLDKWLKSVDV